MIQLASRCSARTASKYIRPRDVWKYSPNESQAEKYDRHRGIGHTRWATHGRPSDENSHPHCSASGRFAIVHNGIIENYAALKKQLEKEGVPFASETDSEVIAHLIERAYTGDFLGAVRTAISQLEGSYALGVLCSEHPEELIAVRNASPLIVGLAEEGNFITSDIPAVLTHTRRVLQLSDHELVRLTRDKVEVFDSAGLPVDKMETVVSWDISSAEKRRLRPLYDQRNYGAASGDFGHHFPRIGADGGIVLDGIRLTTGELQKSAAFTWWPAARLTTPAWWANMLEKLTSVPAEADSPPEFRYRDPLWMKTLWLSSSANRAKQPTLWPPCARPRGAERVLSVVNVVGSTIANESDDVLYTWAGPEISVATTKAYSTSSPCCI